MKPKDVLSIFKICLTAATALAPFIWFHFYPSAPGPDHDSTGKIVAAIGALIVYLVCALYMASIARRIGKADGLAIGYFYNFIYEIEVFVREGCKILDGQTEISYKPEEINYLIIIPDNLHSYYLISDAIKNILTEVTIKPPEELTPGPKFVGGLNFPVPMEKNMY